MPTDEDSKIDNEYSRFLNFTNASWNDKDLNKKEYITHKSFSEQKLYQNIWSFRSWWKFILLSKKHFYSTKPISLTIVKRLCENQSHSMH